MMQANQIASASLLEIIFDGRNKLYGAYTLRRYYSNRLATAITIVLGSCLFFFFTSMGTTSQVTEGPVVDIDTVVFDPYQDQVEPPVIPETPPPVVEQVRTIDYTVPIILPNELVNEDDMPPTVEDIQPAVISTFTQDGQDATGLVAPPPELASGTGLTTVPATSIPRDTIFNKVEMPAEFEGGLNGWRRFLERNLEYPEIAIANGKQATVRMQFVIDQQGSLSEITALNDPGDGLAEEAERIMRKSPKWKPAEQNGQKVKYRHVQSIIFRLQ